MAFLHCEFSNCLRGCRLQSLNKFVLCVLHLDQTRYLCIIGCSLTILRRAFSNVSSNGLPEMMQRDTTCICLAFPHCVFSNVSLKRLFEKMQSHIGCICLTFLRCGFSNVSSNGLPERMYSHIGCICLSFLHCAFSYASSNCLPERMHSKALNRYPKFDIIR